MGNQTNTGTEWKLNMKIQFLYVDPSRVCIRFSKRSGCKMAFLQEFEDLGQKLGWAICSTLPVEPI